LAWLDFNSHAARQSPFIKPSVQRNSRANVNPTHSRKQYASRCLR
jgi:hypothetical protein